MAKRAAHFQRPPVFGNNPSGKGKSQPNTACPLRKKWFSQALQIFSREADTGVRDCDNYIILILA